MALKLVWTAEKIVDEQVEGEYIIRKIHRVTVDGEVAADGMLFVKRLNYGDDWECDNGRGMYCDAEGDLCMIDVDKFIEAIEEYIEGLKLENIAEDVEWDIDGFTSDLKGIRKYAGYTIYVDFKPEA